MKNVSVIVFVIIIVLVLIFSAISFQVRQTETALVTRFGEVARTIDEPGFYWKWPKPVENIRKFDSRSQLLIGRMTETTTRGTEPIIVTSYIVWKVADAEKFFISLSNFDGAEDYLRSRLANSQNTEIGQHYFSEFVNSDVERIKLAEIENNIFSTLKNQAADVGISVEAAGIRQLGISEEVTKSVFERMKSERDRKTAAIIAEGTSEATKIRSEAESVDTQLKAVVESQAKAIRGSGDAKAAKYYEMLKADPEFAMYLRDIEALRKILEEKTTIVLSEDTDLIKLLKGVPDISPKEKKQTQAEDQNAIQNN